MVCVGPCVAVVAAVDADGDNGDKTHPVAAGSNAPVGYCRHIRVAAVDGAASAVVVAVDAAAAFVAAALRVTPNRAHCVPFGHTAAAFDTVSAFAHHAVRYLQRRECTTLRLAAMA